MIGNDIVDLDDVDNARSFARPGYVERVCAPSERETLSGSAEPERLFWAHFAAKEAAYKLLVKLGASPGFSHRELVVAPDLSRVRYREHELELSVTLGPGFVHATAALAGVRPTLAVARTSAEPSGAARRLLAGLVAGEAGCRPSELSVERHEQAGAWDGFGPPVVSRAGVELELDVSLSHDGRFVAAASSARRALSS